MRFQSVMSELGTALPAFAVADPAGRIYSPQDFAGSQGLLVAFICNHCPFVLHILDAFVSLAHQYGSKGVATVAISSNDVVAFPEDGPGYMTALAKKHSFRFPYLYDESQEAAVQFGAACTPDLFLYGPDRRLYYRGQFDRTRPSTPHTQGRPGTGEPATGADLRVALDALLSGKEPPADQRPSMGCSMKWQSGREPAWG